MRYPTVLLTLLVMVQMGCMVDALPPKEPIKGEHKLTGTSVSSSDCDWANVSGKMKDIEGNLLKVIMKLRNKYSSVFGMLSDIKKNVKSVSWYLHEINSTAPDGFEKIQDIIGLNMFIMTSLRDLTINQQTLVTKTFLTETILHLDGKSDHSQTIPKFEDATVYKSCDDPRILETGTYTVQDAFGEPAKVVCVVDFGPGAYTVIQNRFDGSVDFYRSYNDYKKGFGDFNGGEYWLGLDRIHNITNNANYELMIVLEDFDKNVTFARYDNFSIGSGENFYPITKLDGFSGPAGNSFGTAGSLFSAYDLDLDRTDFNCAVANRGAWWYSDCGMSNLNGLYLKGFGGDTSGIFWETFRGQYYSLKRTRIMIKRKRETNLPDEIYVPLWPPIRPTIRPTFTPTRPPFTIPTDFTLVSDFQTDLTMQTLPTDFTLFPVDPTVPVDTY